MHNSHKITLWSFKTFWFHIASFSHSWLINISIEAKSGQCNIQKCSTCGDTHHSNLCSSGSTRGEATATPMQDWKQRDLWKWKLWKGFGKAIGHYTFVIFWGEVLAWAPFLCADITPFIEHWIEQKPKEYLNLLSQF